MAHALSQRLPAGMRAELRYAGGAAPGPGLPAVFVLDPEVTPEVDVGRGGVALCGIPPRALCAAPPRDCVALYLRPICPPPPPPPIPQALCWGAHKHGCSALTYRGVRAPDNNDRMPGSEIGRGLPPGARLTKPRVDDQPLPRSPQARVCRPAKPLGPHGSRLNKWLPVEWGAREGNEAVW